MMWTKVLEYAQNPFLLQRETQQNKADIKECEQDNRENRRELEKIRAEFNQLVFLVQKLSFDIEQIGKTEKSEREKITLQLSNEMLKFERRLPHTKDSEK